MSYSLGISKNFTAHQNKDTQYRCPEQLTVYNMIKINNLVCLMIYNLLVWNIALPHFRKPPQNKWLSPYCNLNWKSLALKLRNLIVWKKSIVRSCTEVKIKFLLVSVAISIFPLFCFYTYICTCYPKILYIRVLYSFTYIWFTQRNVEFISQFCSVCCFVCVWNLVAHIEEGT
jgi:hypothetical protein